MEQIHHCHRRRNPKSEMSGDDHMQGIKINTENKQTTKKDFPAGLSNEANHCLARIRTIPRLRLQSTKSFPPYSECIGGIGDDSDEEWEKISQCSSPRYDEEGEKELDQPSERKKNDCEFNTSFAKANRRAKWGQWERLGTSYEADSWTWECINKKDQDSKQEGQHNKRDVEEEGKWRQSREQNLSQDIKRDDVERRSPESALCQETSKDEEDDEPPVEAESSSTHHPVPHPILSKLLHSTSSSSNSSTMSLSSAESDEVFSDKEDAVSKRTAFRKVRKREIKADDTV